VLARRRCCIGDELTGRRSCLAGEEQADGSFGDDRAVCGASTSIVEILCLNAVSFIEPRVCRLLRCCASIRDMMLGVDELPVPAVRPVNRIAKDSVEAGSESSVLVTGGSSWAALNCCSIGEQVEPPADCAELEKTTLPADSSSFLSVILADDVRALTGLAVASFLGNVLWTALTRPCKLCFKPSDSGDTPSCMFFKSSLLSDVSPVGTRGGCQAWCDAVRDR